MFDGLCLESGVLAAVSIAPEPQQHCRAVVLQADLKGPFRLLGRASLPILPLPCGEQHLACMQCYKSDIVGKYST